MDGTVIKKEADKIEWKPDSISHPDSRFALLLLNNESPRHYDQKAMEIFQDLWTRAKLRVCIDGGTNFILRDSSILRPDIISGDFDSVTPETLSYFKSKGSLIIPTPDQDETDFTKALKIVLSRVKEEQSILDVILAVNTLGGRPDHLLSNFHTLHGFVDETPVLLYDIGSSLSWVLKEGTRHVIHLTRNDSSSSFRHWCSLIPLTGDAIVSTQGLKWNLNQSTLKFGTFISTSNELDPNSSSVEVISNKNILWSMKDYLYTQ